MTILDLVGIVRTTPAEELPAVKAELAAAVAMVDARLAFVAKAPEPPPVPADEPDFTPGDVAADLQIHLKTVYEWCTRTRDPIPSKLYGRARRIPRKPYRAWKARQPEFAS